MPFFLKKRTSDKPLTPNWFYGFIKRWPELKVIKPSGLECCRAKSLNSEVVERYYSELYDVLNEYGLLNSPEKIWNIDEKGISQQHVPPKVVCSKDQKPQAIVSPRLTTTVIGCGNACGTAIPPFLFLKVLAWMMICWKIAHLVVMGLYQRVCGQTALYFRNI